MGRKLVEYVRKPAVLLFLILLFHISWRLVLSLKYPLFDMSDELFHFDYVFKLSEGHGLIDIFKDPISSQVFELAKTVGHWEKELIVTPERIGEVTPEIISSIKDWGWYAFDITGGSSYEGVQPPFYYLVCSFFIRFTDSLALKAYIARIVSVGFSVMMLLSTYWLMKKVSKSEFISLGSVLVLTVLPAWGFQAFRISNDIAAQLFVVLSLLVFYKFYEVKIETCFKSSLILGIVIGLAGLTKVTALLVVLPVLLACYILLSPARILARLRSYVLICIVSGGICFWFYIRNFLLYGDFFGGHAIVQAVYLEKPWVAENIWEVFRILFFDFFQQFPFYPYSHAYPRSLYWFAISLWVVIIAIMLTRFAYDVLPKSIRCMKPIPSIVYLSIMIIFDISYFPFIAAVALPLVFIAKRDYPDRNKIMTILFFTSSISIGIASASFMMTVANISERYVMTISGLIAGYLLYSINSTLRLKFRIPFLLISSFVFAIASFYQEFSVISTLLGRL